MIFFRFEETTEQISHGLQCFKFRRCGRTEQFSDVLLEFRVDFREISAEFRLHRDEHAAAVLRIDLTAQDSRPHEFRHKSRGRRCRQSGMAHDIVQRTRFVSQNRAQVIQQPGPELRERIVGIALFPVFNHAFSPQILDESVHPAE